MKMNAECAFTGLNQWRVFMNEDESFGDFIQHCTL